MAIPGVPSPFAKARQVEIIDNRRNVISISASGNLGFIGTNLVLNSAVTETSDMAKLGHVLDMFSLDTGVFVQYTGDDAEETTLVFDFHEVKSFRNLIMPYSFKGSGAATSTLRVRYSEDNVNWTTLETVTHTPTTTINDDILGNNLSARYIEVYLQAANHVNDAVWKLKSLLLTT